MDNIERDYLEDQFIKETSELAFLHTDNINPKYIKWLEGELYALKQVKNDFVLDDVIKCEHGNTINPEAHDIIYCRKCWEES